MKKVLTIGEIVVELMATEPGDGFLAPTPLMGPYPSGAPAIFIDQVAKLGQPCGIVGCVGKDDFGHLNVGRLRSDGVDVSAISVDPEMATGSAFVRYRKDGQRDFVFNVKHSAAGALRRTRAVASIIARSDHLHVMGSALFSPSVIMLIHDAIDEVKKRGGTVSFDPNIRKEMLELPGMREALRHALANADLFMPSGEELFLFSKAESEAAAVDELLRQGVRAIVVKDGPKGARYYDKDTEVSYPAFPTTEVDPTGAGDTFGATFVTMWLRGVDPTKALQLANASGAIAVSVLGPMEGTCTLSQIESLIQAPEAALTL